MSELAKLEGKLRLVASARRAWLRSPVELPTPQRYAEAGFGRFEADNVWGPGTVEELLDALLRDRHLRVRLTWARSPVVLSGLVPMSAVAFYWPALVGALELAAREGGEGEVALGFGRSRALRVSVGGGQAALGVADLRAEAAAAAGPVRVPGVIEAAKTSRASCRGCRRPIEAGTLRFGAENLARSQPDKPSYRWLHLACAARAMPYSLGPVLREFAGDVPERDALWASLPEDARLAPRPRVWAPGTAVLTKDGRSGEVVWHGPNKYGPGMRVGVQLDGAELVWLPEDEVSAAE